MYLTGRDCDCCSIVRGPLDMSDGGGHEPPDSLEIFRSVDADRVVTRFNRLDPNAALESPQLLERFGALEFRLRKLRQLNQADASVDVQAHVPPRARLRLTGARMRDWRARKVKRKSLAIDHDLRDVR